jgi:dipeptidyl aminopeptidase/acylaminoacyl peptidase
MLHRLSRALMTVLVFGVAPIFAQPSPRPLTHADFDSWRSIASPILSRDGKWLAYSFMPQDGDGDLVLREVSSGREHRIPVGALPLPVPAPAEENTNPEVPPPVRNIRIAFTGDNQFAVATTHPPKADLAAARKAKKKPDEMPKGGLVMVKLATGEVTRVANVKSFQVPAKGGAWAAFLKEPKPGAAKPAEPDGGEKPAEPAANGDEADVDDAAAPARTGAAGTSAAPTAGTRTYGTELVLRDLEKGDERSFASVVDYSMARDGRTLIYTVSSRTPAENGVFVATPGDAAQPVGVLSGRGRYSRLSWDREQTQVAFVSDRDTTGSRNARFKLYLWNRGAAEAKPVVTSETKGLPASLVVSNNASAGFSRDGKKLYVPAATPPKPPRPAGEALADEEKVTADLWHWRDGFIQPMQKSRATQERNRTYRGVLDLASGSYVQLADPTMHSITTSDDGTRVLGYDDRAYRHLVDFDGRFTDIHVVNPGTGERKLALKQLRSESGSALLWSPDGKWASYYQDRQWRVMDTATGVSRSLTAKLRTAFHNEDADRPEPAGAYGSAGWTRDSSSFLVYDRFDVWQLFPEERAPRNLTAGHGRANKIQLRVQRIEPVDEDDDERGIDAAKPLVLRGESEETRATGFFRTTFAANGAPERLLWGDRNHRYIGRARDADVLIVTASRFDEYPDLSLTDSSFGKLNKSTDGGAQMAAYSWGTSELVRFKSADGVALQAALYKPAGFDPKKKYPLLIYIYERLSQNVHNFVNPTPGTSINTSYYVSNGYLVLMPDIVYKTGQPGQSALRCVLPALDAVVARGFVDEKAVGIQGHSWGGYQIAYMLTQTDRFRAAEAGAPVGNMTSAYSGIRWGSGLPRQFQYETGQSRIGRSLQAGTKLFLDNSPIFHIERVKTPLLLMANDNDDAVPWYQGIELFLALRRHGKQAWLFNYNGEFHGLRRRANQKDWAKRMQQFFDHHLKGAPAPKWLEEGIPYIERDEEKQQFNGPAKAEAEPVAGASAP